MPIPKFSQPRDMPAETSAYTPYDNAPPSLRKPSQTYVDNYIARRAVTSTPLAPAAQDPLAVEPHGRGRHTPRVFYKLDTDCPEHYYPPRRHSTTAVRCVRTLLLLLCIVQIIVSFGILCATAVTHFLHDPLGEMYTQGMAALCAFAACAGIVGTLGASRTLLLFLYVNQLWGLANVSTFAVLHITSDEQSTAACRLFRSGELSAQQLEDQGLDCDDVDRTKRLLAVGVGVLLLQLWGAGLLASVYAEMLQDAEVDAHDRALANFVWQRRGETWAKLEKFEDVVQRQFEELRMSLVAHAHQAQAVSSASVAGRPLAVTAPGSRPAPCSPPPVTPSPR